MSTLLSRLPKPSRRAALGLALVAVVLLIAFYVTGRQYAKGSAPVTRAVALVEQDPNVAAFLGSPVSVALGSPRKLWRNPLEALLGDDTVTFITTARGPQGEARLSLAATHTKARGWMGTFSVVIEGEKVPQISGCYMIEGVQVVLKGVVTRDGAPVIRTANKP